MTLHSQVVQMADQDKSLFHHVRIALAWPFYWLATPLVTLADWIDPRPEGPNG